MNITAMQPFYMMLGNFTTNRSSEEISNLNNLISTNVKTNGIAQTNDKSLIYSEPEVTIDLYSKFEKDISEVSDSDFSNDVTNQWQVFNKFLYTNGYYDNMSEKEINGCERVLRKLTQDIDSANLGIISNDIFQGADMNKAEYQVVLESSVATLKYFSNNNLTGELKENFDLLIDKYYTQNKSVTNKVMSLTERVQQSMLKSRNRINYQAGGYSPYANANEKINAYKRLSYVTHTEEENEEIQNAYAERFAQITEENKDEIINQVQKLLLSYITKGIDNENVIKYAKKDTIKTTDRISEMWNYALSYGV